MAEKRRDDSRTVLRIGEGQRKGGMYYYRWTENGKRHSIYANTLTDLRRKEEELKTHKGLGIKVESGYVSLNDLYALWKDMKVGLRDNTFQNYCYTWDLFVKDDLGVMRVKDILKSDVKQFYNRLREQRGLKPNSVDNVHTVLHQVLQVAVDNRFIINNPSDNAMTEFRRSHYNKGEKKHALTVEQQKLLLDFLKTDKIYSHWYPAVAVMLGTGMRVGELTGLRWCDLDLEGRTISINHTLVYYDHRDGDNGRGCYFNVHDTKTEAGERVIPMMQFVKDAFLMEKEYQQENGIICSSMIDGYTDFIFLNRNGCVHHQGSLNSGIRRIIRSCNDAQFLKSPEPEILLPNFSCHNLRHTFATRMCEAGINPKVIQATMGHTDIQTTMNIYAEATKDFKVKEIENFEEKLMNGML